MSCCRASTRQHTHQRVYQFQQDLKFTGVLRISVERTAQVNETKSVIVRSDQTSADVRLQIYALTSGSCRCLMTVYSNAAQVVTTLVEKFGITEHKDIHSLFEVCAGGNAGIYACCCWMSPCTITYHFHASPGVSCCLEKVQPECRLSFLSPL